MVEINGFLPTGKWCYVYLCYNPLILTFDPKFLEHPSRCSHSASMSFGHTLGEIHLALKRSYHRFQGNSFPIGSIGLVYWPIRERVDLRFDLYGKWVGQKRYWKCKTVKHGLKHTSDSSKKTYKKYLDPIALWWQTTKKNHSIWAGRSYPFRSTEVGAGITWIIRWRRIDRVMGPI